MTGHMTASIETTDLQHFPVSVCAEAADKIREAHDLILIRGWRNKHTGQNPGLYPVEDNASLCLWASLAVALDLRELHRTQNIEVWAWDAAAFGRQLCPVGQAARAAIRSIEVPAHQARPDRNLTLNYPSWRWNDEYATEDNIFDVLAQAEKKLRHRATHRHPNQPAPKPQ